MWVGALLFPMDGGGARRGDLAIERSRIAAVSPPDPLPPWADDPALRVDASAAWMLPGFIQTHVHLCQTLFRGLAEGRRLYDWLSDVVWPLEAAHDAATMTVSAEVGVRQLLANGTTTILDMGTAHHTEAIAEVVASLGLRAHLGPVWMDRGPSEARGLISDGATLWDRFERFAARWDGESDGRIRAALCPRFVPSVSDALWRSMTARPDLRRCLIHTHASETRAEVDDVRAETGQTPPRYLTSLPGVSGRLALAHGVWLSADDRAALSEAKAGVTHCPSSNLKLGSGLADVRALERAGVAVGLGADAAACNNRLDPWVELRQSALLEGLLHGPDAVDPAHALWRATAGGAAVLGAVGELGVLRRGARADFLLLDPEADEASLGQIEDSSSALRESPESLLVYAGSARWVRETWIDGRCVHRADDFDRAALSARARAARTRLIALARRQPN